MGRNNTQNKTYPPKRQTRKQNTQNKKTNLKSIIKNTKLLIRT